MKHGVPKVIYLQVCDDPDCDVPYDDHDGITCCSHRIDKTDVMLAELVEQWLKEKNT